MDVTMWAVCAARAVELDAPPPPASDPSPERAFVRPVEPALVPVKRPRGRPRKIR